MNRKQHWEAVYGQRSAQEVSWYQMEPKLSLGLIEHGALGRGEAIIDVGGGASTLVDHLLARGYQNLTVLDVAQNAIQQTQARLGSRSQEVDFRVADITEFSPPRSYALWHDRAVFHFLTEEEDRRCYLEVLNNALIPGGQLIIAAFALDGPRKCSGLDVVRYDREMLSGLLGEHYSCLEEATEVHLTPGGAEQRFVYFRFKKNEC